MWRVLRVLTLSAAIGWIAGAAHAQESIDAAAAQIIADGNAAGVFEAAPAQDQIVLRHSRSGLVCRLDPAFRNRIIIFPQAARGEDVACDSTDGTESVTLYATRLSFEVTPQEVINGAVDAIRQRFPDAREIPAPPASSGAGQSAAQSAQFMVTRDGAPTYTRVTVAIIGQWIIKLRYSLLAPDTEAVARAETAADRIWDAAYSEFTQQPL